MDLEITAVLAIVGTIVLILILRLFGAWLLRINEIIDLLWVIKEMIETKLSQEEIQSVQTKLRSKQEHFSEKEIEQLQAKLKGRN